MKRTLRECLVDAAMMAFIALAVGGLVINILDAWF
jgi:hypothetical protein